MVRKPSEWLKIVKEYHTSNISMTKLANKYGVDSAKLKYLIKLYDLHGEKAFTDDQQDRIFRFAFDNKKGAHLVRRTPLYCYLFITFGSFSFYKQEVKTLLLKQ